MAIDQVDQTVVTQQPTVVATPESVPTTTSQETVRTESRHLTRSGPGGSGHGRSPVPTACEQPETRGGRWPVVGAV